MKKVLIIGCTLIITVMIAAFTRMSPVTIGTEQTLTYFKKNAVAFTTSAKNIKDAIAHISNRDSAVNMDR